MTADADPSARQILDCLPTPIFVVDQDLRILDHNTAAHALLAVPVDAARGQHGGHILNCLNAISHNEGCGQTPFCAKCGLRNALNSAVQGERTVNTRSTMRLVEHGLERTRVFRITVTPMPAEGEPRWILAMEDCTDLAELEQIFPLCPSCREPRDDAAFRTRAEQLLRKRWDQGASLPLCPDCNQRLHGHPTSAAAR